MRDATGVTALEKDDGVTHQQHHRHHTNGSVSSSPSPLPTEKSGHLHHDPEWTGADVDFSHIDGKKVLRKMDLRLIPMLSILYLLAFLDRGNIGNAKIEHMLQDLHMTGPQYNWVVRSIHNLLPPITFPSSVVNAYCLV